MSKHVKSMEMKVLKDTFKDTRDLVVLSVSKIDASVDHTLRMNLRKKNIRLQLVKNTLARRVFGELGMEIKADSPIWSGPSVLAWGAESIGELSKAVDGELKNKAVAAALKDKVTVKGAISDGQPITFDQALKMPTRVEALGRLVGQILGPASRVAGLITAPGARLVSQIKSIGEKEEGEPAAADAPAEG